MARDAESLALSLFTLLLSLATGAARLRLEADEYSNNARHYRYPQK